MPSIQLANDFLLHIQTRPRSREQTPVLRAGLSSTWNKWLRIQPAVVPACRCELGPLLVKVFASPFFLCIAVKTKGHARTCGLCSPHVHQYRRHKPINAPFTPNISSTQVPASPQLTHHDQPKHHDCLSRRCCRLGLVASRLRSVKVAPAARVSCCWLPPPSGRRFCGLAP